MSNGGIASGPLSFIEARDSWADVILSGGVMRRFAKMEILHWYHQDIMKFITIKSEEEENKRNLGEKYRKRYQNSNISVRLTKEFMDAYQITDKTGNSIKADPHEIMKQIALATWKCGDPGVQFEDTMARGLYNVCPEGQYIGTNPCSEYVAMENTSCNLASINAMKFIGTGGKIIDVDALQQVVSILVIAMDAMIENSSYPTEKIKETTLKYRNIGIGFTNAGAALMKLGIPYGSELGRAIIATLQEHIMFFSMEASIGLADMLGSYEMFEKEKEEVRNSINDNFQQQEIYGGKNRETIFHYIEQTKNMQLCSPYNVCDWNILNEYIGHYGLRNAQTTCIAPTGTISFFMGCESTGIEPVISNKAIKSLSDGSTMEIKNKCYEEGLEKYNDPCHLFYKDDAIFATSLGDNIVSPRDHILMCAAVQQFVHGAISKTINLPSNTTPEQIEEYYLLAYTSGMKCVAMYRDGSKTEQVITTKDKAPPKKTIQLGSTYNTDLQAIRHKFNIAGHTGYLHCTCFPGTNNLAEIFIDMSKEGSAYKGLLDSFARAISIALQHGTPLKEIVPKFIGTKFDPQGITKNNEIRFCSSVIDYIFKYIDEKYLTEEDTKKVDDLSGSLCIKCGTITIKSGTCNTCPNCGETTGCG